MHDFLIENPFIYNTIVLLCVVLLKVVLSIFFIKEPTHFFRVFCNLLANKVNKQSNSVSQQKIAGVIGVLTTLLPIVIILWLFEDFIEVTWLWHAFLLYLALGSFGLTRYSMKIAKALRANKTDDAKKILSPLVLRNTDQLSTLGLCKTTIEMQLIQTLQQCFTVAFYFIVAGPLFAITIRLLLEIHYSWNIKVERFKAFGKYVNKLIQVLQWLPTRLFIIVFMLGTLGQNFIVSWQQINQHFFKLNNNIALHGLALAINTKLGGVAMYHNKKLRRLSFNSNAQEPQPNDIIHAIKRINQVLYFSLLSLVLLSFIFVITTVKV